MKTLLSKLIGFALTVLGAKLWLIGAYGVTIPLWDAWRQEGMKIYKPWIEGQFTPGMLFINNNVHHIGCTRLADLALFILNSRQWDVRTELVANALLHVIGSTAILAMIYRQSGRFLGDLALVAMGLCLVVPFAYVNTLWGYQSQFYFLVFFSVATIWGLLDDDEPERPRRRFQPRSWCGRIAAFLACYTMGSGFAAAGIGFVLLAARCWWRGQWRRALPNLLAGAAATLLGTGLFASAVHLMRQNAHQGNLGHLSHQAGWLPNVLAVTGWPIGGGTQPWGGLLLYAPFGCWLWRRWQNRPRTHTPPEPHPVNQSPGKRLDAWFFAGFGLWALAQGVSIGLLRGVPPGSRHLDALLFGTVVNLLALGGLWREVSASHGVASLHRTAVRVAAVGGLLWLIVTGLGLFSEGQRVWQKDLPDWKTQMPAYQRAVEQFAATDDSTDLEDHPAPFFDAPKWQRLADFLEDNSLREALSVTLKLSAPGEAAKPIPLPKRVLTALIPAAVPCFALGGLLLVITFGVRLGAREDAAAPT